MMDPENAHDKVLRLARLTENSGVLQKVTRFLYDYQSEYLHQRLMGLDFRNPLGNAAGFDKNGTLTLTLQTLGLGFAEAGSITAHPSAGNSRPRLFRLTEDQAVINRMGLNNEGADTITQRLNNIQADIPVGVNIAKTHDASITGNKAIEDYLKSFRLAGPVADYIVLNVSCPNTDDGKTFEQKQAFSDLITAVSEERTDASKPLLVKFSPDLEENELKDLVEIAEKHDINGYAAVNTSSLREGLRTDAKKLDFIGPGGLSGRPLHRKSCRVIRQIREIAGDKKSIIGIGGIDSFDAALETIRSGADLLQVYSGLVYEGPSLVRNINKKLSRFMQKEQLQNLKELQSYLAEAR